MGVVSLQRPSAVSGIAAAGARLARLPEPWRPVVIGPDLAPDCLLPTPLRDAPGATLCSWPSMFGPVAQVLFLRERLRELGADVIVPNDLPHGFAAGALDHHRGARVAAWLHADHYDGDELLERCGGCADAWRSVSERGRARAISTAQAAGLPIPAAGDTCPACVDVPADATRPPADGPPRLLYAGRLERHIKRVMDLASLADELHSRAAPFVLRIAGDGPARAALEAALAAHVEAGRAEFLGPVAFRAMPALIDESDLLLLLSESEGMPTVVMEAMARGRPAAVTTGCGGAVSLVRDGHDGLIVPTGDMRSLARRLAALASDRGALARMGLAAHAKALTTCSMPALSPRYEAFIAEARRASCRIDPASPESVSAQWKRILAALEAIGPCTGDSLRTLASGWLGELSLSPGARRQLSPGSALIPIGLPGRPSPAERLLADALQRLGRRGASRIVLYGCGRHTARVARTIARFAAPASRPRVVAIIDDAAGAPGGPPPLFEGLPVLAPSQVGTLRPDAIVISSDEHERDMLPRARALRGSPPVVALYQDAAPTGSPLAA